jgi:protein-L-isoaspartate O-methyltransferase
MAKYLDIQARLGGEFIHPGARDMTEVLLSRVRLRPADRVLEIGGGTGATAALLAQRTGAHVSLLERSGLMLTAAQERLSAQPLLTQVTATQADGNFAWPFVDACFELVYAESVVALLDVQHVLSEAVRVLRPGGRLIMNERVWKVAASQSEVDHLNAISREVFGIPAATDQALDGNAWLRLMHDAGLIDVSAEPVDALLPAQRWRAPQARRLKRLRRYARHTDLLWQVWRAKRQNRQYAALFTNLECFFFSARKPA